MNKKTICLYLHAHYPSYLRHYQFFDMGKNHDYYDDHKLSNGVQELTHTSIIPTNDILLDIIQNQKKKVKLAISITGELMNKLEQYAPEGLESFKKLAKTGCVEFVAETYSHSLAFIQDETEFEEQLNLQVKALKKHFKVTPTSVKLSGLIYSDQIGEKVLQMGYNTILTENARHIMAWKSPHYVYSNAVDNKLNVLLRDSVLCDEMNTNFSNPKSPQWPITAEKVGNYLRGMQKEEEISTIYLDYPTFGIRHSKQSGIFDFLKYLPTEILKDSLFEFLTPTEATKKHKAVDSIDVPYPISSYEEECDLTVWLGNDMQQDAFDSLCKMAEKIRFVDDKDITSDWRKLQDTEHFYFMGTRWRADRRGVMDRNPYNSPFDAYINYMNVLNDLELRVDSKISKAFDNSMKNEKFVKEVVSYFSKNRDLINYTPEQLQYLVELANKTKKKENVKDKH